MDRYSVRVTTEVGFEAVVRADSEERAFAAMDNFRERLAYAAAGFMPGCSESWSHTDDWSDDDAEMLPDGTFRISIWFSMMFEFPSAISPTAAVRTVGDGIRRAVYGETSRPLGNGVLSVTAEQYDDERVYPTSMVREGENIYDSWNVWEYVSREGLEPSGMWENRISDVLKASGLNDSRWEWAARYSSSILDEAARIVEREWY